MVKESARKCICGHSNNCSHRHSNGNGKLGYHHHHPQSVKLFGVSIATKNSSDQLDSEEQSLKKSFSVGSLVSHPDVVDVDDAAAGYLSEGDINDRYCNSRRIRSSKNAGQERRKGKAWTEDEHRVFLAGLKKLGKGDWRGIAKKYVTTRTPTQVASHAQKYFLRLHHPPSADSRKKRRSSLFDISLQPPQHQSISPSNLPHSALSSFIKDTADHQTLAIANFTQDAKSLLGSEKNLKGTTTQQPQVAAQQIALQFPHLCLDDHPFTELPPATPTPPQYGGPPVWQSYIRPAATPSYEAPARRPYIVELPIPNNLPPLVTGIPVPHPSGIPSPRSRNSLRMFQFSPQISQSTQTDPLELQIGPPQSSNISSEGLGAIRVT